MANKFTVEALRGPVFHGVKYKRVRSFGKERDAEAFADSLPVNSRRFPPVVEMQRIGWRFGYKFNVCVQK